MKTIFVGNNTPQGFYGFYDEKLATVKMTYILKGAPGTGKSTFIKKLAKEADNLSEDYEIWLCSGDPNSYDGIYLPNRKIAVVDGTRPHTVDVNLPVLNGKMVDIESCVDVNNLKKNRLQIENLAKEKGLRYFYAYQQLASAKQNELALNKPYLESLSELKLIQIAKNLAERIKYNIRTTNQFAKALTADGVVYKKDYLENKRIIGLKCEKDIVGMVFLKNLINILNGCDQFRNTLLPEYSESIVCGDFAVLIDDDCNCPDEIIDLGSAIKKVNKIDLNQEKKLKERAISTAILHLYESRELHKKIENYYIDSMNFEKLNEIYENVKNGIFKK